MWKLRHTLKTSTLVPDISTPESSSPRPTSLLLTSSHSELCSVLQIDYVIIHIHFLPSLSFPCVSPSPTYSSVSVETSLFPGASQNPGIQVQFSSVHSVVSGSLQHHELQHARAPCPSPAPGVYPNPGPLSQWCHPAISSSVIPFSSCLQSFPASGSFPMSQLFASGGQSIGVSASASVLPMNTQDWSALGWTGWISLQSKGLSRVFSNTTVQKHQFFGTQLSLYSQLSFQLSHPGIQVNCPSTILPYALPFPITAPSKVYLSYWTGHSRRAGSWRFWKAAQGGGSGLGSGIWPQYTFPGPTWRTRCVNASKLQQS